jgi:lysyl-tRNA synthetase class II
VLFVDLRDHYGMTQCVVDPDSPAFGDAEKLRSEWVVRVDGKVRQRPDGTRNADLPTGDIEVFVTAIEVLGPAAELPLPVFGDQPFPEETRLKYRFLDLRREKLHANVMKRGAVIDFLRAAMKEQGFFEFRDADPHRIVAGRRARLSGALAPACRPVLRAAPGPAAVQATADDGGLRPLFPDRALLSRRGSARRPAAGRVLPARSGDELCHPGRRVRRQSSR